MIDVCDIRRDHRSLAFIEVAAVYSRSGESWQIRKSSEFVAEVLRYMTRVKRIEAFNNILRLAGFFRQHSRPNRRIVILIFCVSRATTSGRRTMRPP